MAASLSGPTGSAALPLDPHDWGVVPAVWLKEWTAEPGELDGRSILRPSVLSLSEQADYVASFGVQSTNRNADPDIATIDVARTDQVASAELGRRPQRTTGGKTFAYTSIGQHPEVKLLETQGTAADASREQLRLLRQVLADNTGVVRHDPEKASGVQSGEALRRMLRPFLQLVDAYRTILEEGLVRLVELVGHVLRVERQVSAEHLTASVTWPDVVPLTPQDALAWGQAGQALVAAEYPVDEVVKLLATKLGHPDAEAVAKAAAADAEAKMEQLREAIRSRPPAKDEAADDASGG